MALVIRAAPVCFYAFRRDAGTNEHTLETCLHAGLSAAIALARIGHPFRAPSRVLRIDKTFFIANGNAAANGLPSDAR
jgi:hypothetical protein